LHPTFHKRLRRGDAGYTTSFIEHDVLPLVYPPALSTAVQFALAAGLRLLDLAVYGAVAASRGRSGGGS